MKKASNTAIAPGVIFHFEGGVIRARVTTRADRFADRLQTQRRRIADYDRARRLGHVVGVAPQAEIAGVICTPTEALAEALVSTLYVTFCRPGTGGTYTPADVGRVLAYCRRKRLKVYGLQGDPVDKPILRKALVEVRAVPDPMIPRETLIEQLADQEADEAAMVEQHIRERRQDRRGRTAPALAFDTSAQPGYQYAGINLSEAIGGFTRVAGRTEAQTEAAMQFRRLADHAQLGGARAFDYAAVKVDTSGQTASAVADTGADARAQYHAARSKVGFRSRRLAVIEMLVVGGLTVSAIATQLGYGSSGRARTKVSALALEAATVLAMHFGFQARGSRRARFAGDHPTDASIP